MTDMGPGSASQPGTGKKGADEKTDTTQNTTPTETGARDEFATLGYEFRRHLAVVYGNSELLLEEAFGSLSSDQREALEEIVANTGELTALTAHTFETNDIEDAIDRADQLPDSTGSDESTLADPDAFDPIVLALQSETFADLVAEQLELAGHEAVTVEVGAVGTEAVTDGADDESETLDDPHHLVVDCGFPTPETIDWLGEITGPTEQRQSVTLVSTVDPVAIEAEGTQAGGAAGDTVRVTGPLLGIDGVLDPDASQSTVADLLADELVHTPDAPSISTVHIAGDGTEPLASSLAGQSYTVQRQTTATLPELDPSGDSCLFLGPDVFDRYDPLTLSRFRSPADAPQRPIPIVAVAEFPISDQEWEPTCGSDLFAHKPITAAEFAAELRCWLPGGDD
ncbi:histidine kinase [Natrialba hulunbeirensis JCM 10989]|uniref:Histidine kinase n=1 Tax=Natrialba hulunbeirensis JCM 10989 TaxID=1227493 RepID=M0A7H3_9EURY|nr:hypothetical protein [Natrialba hulunbeirensis]ELY93842.1 histidine kinase [Natrialba hulunbeirensis JCM 10989]